MAKKKLKVTDAKITKDANGNYIISGVEKDIPVVKNLDNELGGFVGLDSLELALKQKSSREVKKTPTYKFSCKCGKQIKSKEELLNCKCLDCDSQFEIED
jgi:NADH pyrophosphatase NudC (nudix superfamily)